MHGMQDLSTTPWLQIFCIPSPPPQAPTRPGSRRDPTSTSAASGLPSRGAHTGGEDVGVTGAAGNAHPRKHRRALLNVTEGCALTRIGVK